jgi:beta-hydroxylase
MKTDALTRHDWDSKPRFYDCGDFDWIPPIEAGWRLLREEADRLLSVVELLPAFSDIQVEQERLAGDRRWKILPLYAYGRWVAANERRCPATAAALRGIPGLQAAMFSILQAGKELPPHRGPNAGVLRYHLALKVPQPASACGICVGGEVRHWEDGKSMVFDDIHEHHAWNRTHEDRVVLFVDFARPLPPEETQANEALLAKVANSPFIQDAFARWTNWEATHGARLDGLLADGLPSLPRGA